MSALGAVVSAPTETGGTDDGRGLKRKHPDSTSDDTASQERTPVTDQVVVYSHSSDNNGSSGVTIKPDASEYIGIQSSVGFAAMLREAEAKLNSSSYQPYLFNPTTPTGYCFGGMRLEMFRTDTIGGSVGDIYFVCVESFFNTAGPLGLKLTLSTQGSYLP